MDTSPEPLSESQVPPFSQKVLVMSVFFMMLNICVLAIHFLGQKQPYYQPVAPSLAVSAGQSVLLRGPYDDFFSAAIPNQPLYAGTLVKTDGSSSAEIRLEENTIRLDANTEILLSQINEPHPGVPRMVFGLLQGQLRVNAFDSVLVKTDRADALFSHEVGLYSYTSNLNQVFSVTGITELSLKEPVSGSSIPFSIPFRSKASFADSQILPEYARLEYSKLKKELRLAPLPADLLSDPWILRQTRDTLRVRLIEDGAVSSLSEYLSKERGYAWLERLSFFNKDKTDFRLARCKTLIRYLLSTSPKDSKTLLSGFDPLCKPIQQDPRLSRFAERQFFGIQSATPGSVAQQVRDLLRDWLLARGRKEWVRTYLSDIDYLLRISRPEEASASANLWLSSWKPGLLKSDFAEFELEARAYHGLLLSNASLATNSLLKTLNDAEDLRLAHSSKPDEALYEIALERLDLSKTLVAAGRFAMAGDYLRTSYGSLKFEERGSTATREIFVKDAAFLGDRIAFAIQNLHGVAGPIDEKAFADYLASQLRDKTIEERFQSFMLGKVQPENVVAPPSVSDVVSRFTAARINVFPSDLNPSTRDPFEFEFKDARLLDPSPDGTDIVFSGRFSSITNALSSIQIKGTDFPGNFSLTDFVSLMLKPTASTSEVAEDKRAQLAELLSQGKLEEADRLQRTAQDLAVQVAIGDLQSFGILVGSPTQLSVLDLSKLNRFHVRDAVLEDIASRRRATVSFDYDSSEKTLSNVVVDGANVDLPSSIPADRFVDTIFSAISSRESAMKALNSAVSELSAAGYILEPQKARFTDSTFRLLSFTDLRLKAVPVLLSGTYDFLSKRFVRAESPFLTVNDISTSDYARESSTAYVLQTLSDNGISLTTDNLDGNLPAERITVLDYVRGDKSINFTYDIANNRLIDIYLTGSTSKVPSMTFDEFARIGQ